MIDQKRALEKGWRVFDTKRKISCPNCGAEIDEVICPACGSYIEEPACDAIVDEDDLGG